MGLPRTAIRDLLPMGLRLARGLGCALCHVSTATNVT